MQNIFTGNNKCLFVNFEHILQLVLVFALLTLNGEMLARILLHLILIFALLTLDSQMLAAILLF